MALKSRAASKDWNRVSRLCEAAVQSAYRQTDPDIRIVLVCNEKPEFHGKFDHRLEVISVDFPVPPADPKAAMLDKWKKLTVGMVRVGELHPDFVMNMDADDLVSNRIAAWAHAHRQSNGAVIRNGYVHRPGSRWIECVPRYNCGTNAIVSARLIKFPLDCSEKSIAECSILRWGHTVIEAKLEETGTPLEILPFRGGIYLVGHGDSWTAWSPRGHVAGLKFLLKNIRSLRPVTASLRKEFAMDYLPR
jgi:hypothetical protein